MRSHIQFIWTLSFVFLAANPILGMEIDNEFDGWKAIERTATYVCKIGQYHCKNSAYSAAKTMMDSAISIEKKGCEDQDGVLYQGNPQYSTWDNCSGACFVWTEYYRIRIAVTCTKP